MYKIQTHTMDNFIIDVKEDINLFKWSLIPGQMSAFYPTPFSLNVNKRAFTPILS